MTMLRCPTCAEEIGDDADECPGCESPLGVSLYRQAQPAAGEGRLVLAKLMAVAMLGWLGVQAYLSWQAFDQGYTGLLVPGWNSLVVLGSVLVVAGVFRRSAWARQWAMGISTLTAVSLVYHAQGPDTRILWIGIAVLVVAALAIGAAKQSFTAPTSVSPAVQRAVAIAALAASVLVAFASSSGEIGTARGRARMAADLQATYDRHGETQVRVYALDRALVVEQPAADDAGVDAMADEIRAELALLVSRGERPRAWAVGFQRIVITNGSHRRAVTP